MHVLLTEEDCVKDIDGVEVPLSVIVADAVAETVEDSLPVVVLEGERDRVDVGDSVAEID